MQKAYEMDIQRTADVICQQYDTTNSYTFTQNLNKRYKITNEPYIASGSLNHSTKINLLKRKLDDISEELTIPILYGKQKKE
jgi:hypothetical protein